jgi:hypothetical protein
MLLMMICALLGGVLFSSEGVEKVSKQYLLILYQGCTNPGRLTAQETKLFRDVCSFYIILAVVFLTYTETVILHVWGIERQIKIWVYRSI